MNPLRILLAVAALAGSLVSAQTPPPAAPLGIKGKLSINYASRGSNGKAIKDKVDTYTFETLNIANSSHVSGTIVHRPHIPSLFGNPTQTGQLAFNLDLAAINPRNPAQQMPVGKLVGTVPVSDQNVYAYGDGTRPDSAKVSVFGGGNVRPFDSAFKGSVYGRPSAKTSLLDSTKATLRITNSKGAALNLSRYDIARFESHTLGAGPIPIYGETILNGTVVYSYEKDTWVFKDLTATYADAGKRVQDSIAGYIRWVKQTNTYIADIRVNEPPASEAALFAPSAGADDFFAADNTAPSLTGTLVYVDIKQAGIVTGSTVTINLVGNKLSQGQITYLAKMLLLSMVVPLNAE